ncbi:MAG: zinc-ribbon domain-containing protein [Pedosphaera sp.]|nr:zinc-ribbon domain-containing protein [Pedosphaera sp.]
MSRLLPCSMCGNDLSPWATFCPKCGYPRVGAEPE